jgi:crossover junction endodeoxyribonuclease RuvC
MARHSARALWTEKILQGQLSKKIVATKTRALKTPASQRGVRAIILGIDPSLRGTGLAVIDTRGSRPKLLASQTLKLTAKLAAYECLGKIAEAVEALTLAHQPTHVAIEATIYVQNFRTAQAMGASRGAALSVVARLGLLVSEYAPKRIKMAVTGHGGASKEQVSRMIQSLFHLETALPWDESDAAAIALCHAYTGK